MKKNEKVVDIMWGEGVSFRVTVNNKTKGQNENRRLGQADVAGENRCVFCQDEFRSGMASAMVE